TTQNVVIAIRFYTIRISFRCLARGWRDAETVTLQSYPTNGYKTNEYNTPQQRSRQYVVAVHEGFILDKLTNEEVRKAVELFWTTFLAKSEDLLNSYYAPGSTIFQISMGRAEPGRLGAMRRSREYFRPDTRMELKLGPMDVVLIGSDAGIASYTFHFQATGRDVGGGKRVEEKLDLVRATHVFQRDSQGRLRILHEHFSVPVT